MSAKRPWAPSWPLVRHRLEPAGQGSATRRAPSRQWPLMAPNDREISLDEPTFTHLMSFSESLMSAGIAPLDEYDDTAAIAEALRLSTLEY